MHGVNEQSAGCRGGLDHCRPWVHTSGLSRGPPKLHQPGAHPGIAGYDACGNPGRRAGAAGPDSRGDPNTGTLGSKPIPPGTYSLDALMPNLTDAQRQQIIDLWRAQLAAKRGALAPKPVSAETQE